NQGHHIVVDKATLYYNGKSDDNARYPVKMACDTEQSCEFEFSQDIYNYMGVALPISSELAITYWCKQYIRDESSKRFNLKEKTTDKCPQDTFVQKHIGLITDSKVALRKDSPEVRREWEIIAMAVASQAQQFREASRAKRLIDPTVYTVFLIYRIQKGDFHPTPDKKNCELTDGAVKRSIKYQCNRFTNAKKWTCNFVSKQVDKAVHDSITGHYH
ncbi:hypothetical protein KR074_012620, partial [Drosophila pseudoananassae]